MAQSSVGAKEPGAPKEALFTRNFLLACFIRRKELSFVWMCPLPQPGSVAAPTDVAEIEFPVRVPRQPVAFNVRCIQSLLRNAVSQENDPVPIPEKFPGGGAPRQQAQNLKKEQPVQETFHKLDVYWLDAKEQAQPSGVAPKQTKDAL